MNNDLLQQQFAIRDSTPKSGLMRAMGTLKDPIAERLRQHILKLMGTMEQKELVQRCHSPHVRIDQIHKLVNGDLQFPPLSFLDAVFRAFGSSLREAMEQEPAIRPLAISRADVQIVARMLGACGADYVELLRLTLEEGIRTRSRSRGRGASPGAATEPIGTSGATKTRRRRA